MWCCLDFVRFFFLFCYFHFWFTCIKNTDPVSCLPLYGVCKICIVGIVEVYADCLVRSFIRSGITVCLMQKQFHSNKNDLLLYTKRHKETVRHVNPLNINRKWQTNSLFLLMICSTYRSSFQCFNTIDICLHIFMCVCLQKPSK